MLNRKGYYTVAIGHCEKALNLNPEDLEIMNRLAWLYAKKEVKLDLGVELINKTLKVHPNRTDYIDTLSELYYVQGKIIEAVKKIREAINLNPDDPYYKQQLWRFKNVTPKILQAPNNKLDS